MSHTLIVVLDSVLSLAGLGVLIWLFIRGVKNSEAPAKMVFKTLLTVGIVIGEVFFVRAQSKHLAGGMSMGDFGTALMMAGSIAFCGIILSIIWAPHIGELISKPLTSLFDGGSQPPEPKPYYSIAIGRRKKNQPLEAIVAVREQLAKFPDDYEGLMLLAAIQAEDTKDLQGAEITLNHFCDLPAAPPKQVAAALTQLADWHLKLAQDTDSARAALDRIIAKYPDSALSMAASQRIAHLGGVKKILLGARDRRPIALPEGVKSAGLRDSMADLVPAEADPAQLAAAYVKQLEQHPLDTEAREKLAILYANHYHRLDLAAGELNQLAGMPNQPGKQVAHWLNLLADLQVQSGADFDTVRPTLEQIVQRFPDLPAGAMARSRLSHLKLEIKGKQKEPPGKVLGDYEQNIGLKRGSPRGL